VGLGMLAFATMNVAFAFYRTMNAFISFRGGSAPDFLLGDLVSWVCVVEAVDYSFQTLIGNSILIYCCFVVYKRNRFVVTPSIVMSIGSLVWGIMVIWREATLPPGAISTQDRRTLIMATLYGLCSTAATNVLTTSLVVYRIWSAKRIQKTRTDSGGSTEPRLSRLIQILIESGLLYTIFVVAYLVELLAYDSMAVLPACIIQIIGINFNLIIIRVHQHDAAPQVSSVSGGDSKERC